VWSVSKFFNLLNLDALGANGSKTKDRLFFLAKSLEKVVEPVLGNDITKILTILNY
jgi:hypothetical protein